jgi:hypothetical protein
MVKRLRKEGFWVRGVDLKYPDFSETEANEFIKGDLRDIKLVEKVLRNRDNRTFDQIYQFAADMGGAGFVFTGENDAHIMHNSVSINLNVLDQQVKLNEILNTNNTIIFYSGSACMYPEYNELDNKIKEFSKILNETDKTKNDIDALTNIIEISENKKTKINSRLLLEDDKIFDLIDEEKKLSINKIKFFIDLQNLNLIDPELEAKKEIKIINEELENIKIALNNKKIDINTNNKILIDYYKSLEKLYNANRYNEYLIKDDGSLVIFRDEEEKIKNIISDLEKKKSQFQNEINSLKKEVKLKDKEVKNI